MLYVLTSTNIAATNWGSGKEPGVQHSNRKENLNMPDFMIYWSTSFFSFLMKKSLPWSSVESLEPAVRASIVQNQIIIQGCNINIFLFFFLIYEFMHLMLTDELVILTLLSRYFLQNKKVCFKFINENQWN